MQSRHLRSALPGNKAVRDHPETGSNGKLSEYPRKAAESPEGKSHKAVEKLFGSLQDRGKVLQENCCDNGSAALKDRKLLRRACISYGRGMRSSVLSSCHRCSKPRRLKGGRL